MSFKASRRNRSRSSRDQAEEVYRSSPIPVPPLPEQQRIVGILDEAFEGIATAKANAEKNLQNARALFESHLRSVFTQRGEGGWRTLGELADDYSVAFDITKDLRASRAYRCPDWHVKWRLS